MTHHTLLVLFYRLISYDGFAVSGRASLIVCSLKCSEVNCTSLLQFGMCSHNSKDIMCKNHGLMISIWPPHEDTGTFLGQVGANERTN
jgi:hypothetical protein